MGDSERVGEAMIPWRGKYDRRRYTNFIGGLSLFVLRERAFDERGLTLEQRRELVKMMAIGDKRLFWSVDSENNPVIRVGFCKKGQAAELVKFVNGGGVSG